MRRGLATALALVATAAIVVVVALWVADAPAPVPIDGIPQEAPTSQVPTPADDTPPPRPEPIATPSATPTATPTPSPEVTRPGPGPSTEPLRVWVAGDSMWELAGPALATRLEATGRAVVEVDVRYSSGLTRPDFLDWAAHARERLAVLDPHVVLFSVGANDSQPLVVDGVRNEPGTEAFAEVYRARTRALMTLLADDGRQVRWVGLPAMRRDDYDARMAFLNAIHEEEAAEVSRVTYVPTRELFTDEQGRYADRLATPDGTVEVMRGADGIHLSPAGADRLAAHLVACLEDMWPARASG